MLYAIGLVVGKEYLGYDFSNVVEACTVGQPLKAD